MANLLYRQENYSLKVELEQARIREIDLRAALAKAQSEKMELLQMCATQRFRAAIAESRH